jgi:hypothetical protein
MSTKRKQDVVGEANVDQDTHKRPKIEEESNETEEDSEVEPMKYERDICKLQEYLNGATHNHINSFDAEEMDLAFYKERHYFIKRGEQGALCVHLPAMRVNYKSEVDGQMSFPNTNFYQMKWNLCFQTGEINKIRNCDAHQTVEKLKEITQLMLQLALRNDKLKTKIQSIVNLEDLVGDEDAQIKRVMESGNMYLPYKSLKDNPDEYQITTKSPVWQYQTQKFNYKPCFFSSAKEYDARIEELSEENKLFQDNLIEKHAAGNSRTPMFINVPRIFDMVNKERIRLEKGTVSKDDIIAPYVQPKLIFGPKSISVRLQHVYMFKIPGLLNVHSGDAAGKRFDVVGNI